MSLAADISLRSRGLQWTGCGLCRLALSSSLDYRFRPRGPAPTSPLESPVSKEPADAFDLNLGRVSPERILLKGARKSQMLRQSP